jgi:hypothetical protein
MQPGNASRAESLAVRTIAVAASIALAGMVAISGAAAQTLTAPNPPATRPPAAAAKSPSSAHVKSCAAFGAGFVNVAGTDACVKIGGFVDIDATASPGR